MNNSYMKLKHIATSVASISKEDASDFSFIKRINVLGKDLRGENYAGGAKIYFLSQEDRRDLEDEATYLISYRSMKRTKETEAFGRGFALVIKKLPKDS